MEKFYCKTAIIAGCGAIKELIHRNIKRLFLVCDPFFAENGTADALVRAAGEPAHQIFSQVIPDPSVTLAAKGAALVMDFKPDTVVALGGGSAMDLAKAMVYFSQSSAGLVAIPTTSGSGSEVTDFAILTHEGVKNPLVDERLRPELAILDSDLVASLPPGLVAEGGFDLISHTIEAYAAKNAGEISDLYAERALKTALEELLPSYSADRHSREKMHLGATMAGIAFSQAGLGICHAISHSLGGEFHLPHGRLNAILLPAVMESNAAVCGRRYAQLARAIGLTGVSDLMAQRALKNALLRMRRSLQLPETLAQAGISPALVEEKMERLVSAALADPCCRTNPLPPTKAILEKILHQVMGHG